MNVAHQFQGRYQAILVDANTYLLELVRYIHLNPVRARMVSEPGAYASSGHRAYLGQERVPWLTTDWVLGQFSKRRSTARERYRRFVNEGVEEGYREDFYRGVTDPRVLGDDVFMEDVLGSAAKRPVRPRELDEIIEAVCRSYDVGQADRGAPGRRRDLAEARAVVAHLATSFGDASLTEVAARFGRDVATLSSGLRRLATRSRDGAISQQAKGALQASGLGG